MTGWRQGQSVPHHVYAMSGDEPDTRPFPVGDRPVATFFDPDDAELCVRAVESEWTRYEPHASVSLDRTDWELTATCKCGVSEIFPTAGDAEARTWWERHQRAAAHALDYRAGFDDGVRYARDHDAMAARMGSTPTDPGPDGERAMQCDSTWPLRPTPTTGHAACHLMLDHHGLHMDFAGQTWADETMSGTPTNPRRDAERGLSGKVSGLDREPTASDLGLCGRAPLTPSQALDLLASWALSVDAADGADVEQWVHAVADAIVDDRGVS